MLRVRRFWQQFAAPENLLFLVLTGLLGGGWVGVVLFRVRGVALPDPLVGAIYLVAGGIVGMLPWGYRDATTGAYINSLRILSVGLIIGIVARFTVSPFQWPAVLLGAGIGGTATLGGVLYVLDVPFRYFVLLLWNLVLMLYVTCFAGLWFFGPPGATAHLVVTAIASTLFLLGVHQAFLDEQEAANG